MFNYNAYNLGICSALPLPELQPSAEVVADVTIRLGQLDWSPKAVSSDEEDLSFEIGTNEAHFFWPQVGTFRVSGGTEITIQPIDGVEDRLVRLPLLGTIIATLLHQRGNLVLHASAVSIEGEAVAFVGNKGRGKSTMAATLYGLGHELLADDVVALTTDHEGRPLVLPGFPQVKLYPDAACSSLGNDPASLSELAEGYEKCGRRLTDRFSQRAVPLKRIYVLGAGTQPKVTELDAQTSLLALISNSYMARFGRQLLSGDEASLHLRKCAGLMNHVGIYRLERPGDLNLLPSIGRLVNDHLQNDTKTACAVTVCC
ncbi:MAG TPA: hypothetical protein VIB00_11000 [Pyrinomonadaceae bacterium]|jgi:hypothetical protein